MGVATAIGLAGLAVSAASAANSADNQRKALHAQQDQLKASQATADTLGQSTQDLSKQNALASAELERQLTPEVQQLRTSANQNLLNGLNSNRYDMSGNQSLLQSQVGQPANTPLLNAAIEKARGDLALGGQLSTDAQNLATRQALAKAGTVGGGGLGLGRDLVARDLGLTSMQVEQQRLQNASQLGGQELQLGQFNASNLLNHINLLNQINSNGFGRDLATAQYAESIARPTVGIDPGSAANLQIAQQNAQGAAAANAANVKGQQQQGYLNAAGQVTGGALALYNQYKQGQQNNGYVPFTNQDIYNTSMQYQQPAATPPPSVYGSSPYPYVSGPTY